LGLVGKSNKEEPTERIQLSLGKMGQLLKVERIRLCMPGKKITPPTAEEGPRKPDS